jgi:ATP-dependent protease ClpP protease subunit
MRKFAALTVTLFTISCTPPTHSLRPKSPDEPILLPIFDEPAPAPEKVSVVCEPKKPCVPTYRFNDEVGEVSVKQAIAWIDAANAAGAQTIVFELNTPGGSVPDGFELAKAIENSKAPVVIVVDGEAASMGGYLLESASIRYMTFRSSLMFHSPSLGAMFQGTPEQWQAVADMLKAMANAIANHCAYRMNISLEQYHEKTDGSKMWWLGWEEALSVQAIDMAVPSVAYVIQLHKELLSNAANN